MYNRYDGNTGRFVRVADTPPSARYVPPNPARPAAIPQSRGEAPAAPMREKRPPSLLGGGLGELLPLGGLQKALGGILPRVLPDGLETEDLLLLVVLYLMYKESGDKELLIILGAMFLL